MTLTNQIRFRRTVTLSTDGLSSIGGEIVLEQFFIGDLLKGELDQWVPVQLIEEKKTDDAVFQKPTATEASTA